MYETGKFVVEKKLSKKIKCVMENELVTELKVILAVGFGRWKSFTFHNGNLILGKG